MTLQITPLFINTTMKYNLLFFQYSKTKSADHGYIEILLNHQVVIIKASDIFSTF